jgi:hypothetical protein
VQLLADVLFWIPAAVFLSGYSTYILGLPAIPAFQRIASRYPEFHGGQERPHIGPDLVLYALVMAVGAGAAWAHLLAV